MMNSRPALLGWLVEAVAAVTVLIAIAAVLKRTKRLVRTNQSDVRCGGSRYSGD